MIGLEAEKLQEDLSIELECFSYRIFSFIHSRIV